MGMSSFRRMKVMRERKELEAQKLAKAMEESKVAVNNEETATAKTEAVASGEDNSKGALSHVEVALKMAQEKAKKSDAEKLRAKKN